MKVVCERVGGTKMLDGSPPPPPGKKRQYKKKAKRPDSPTKHIPFRSQVIIQNQQPRVKNYWDHKADELKQRQESARLRRIRDEQEGGRRERSSRVYSSSDDEESSYDNDVNALTMTPINRVKRAAVQAKETAPPATLTPPPLPVSKPGKVLAKPRKVRANETPATEAPAKKIRKIMKSSSIMHSLTDQSSPMVAPAAPSNWATVTVTSPLTPAKTPTIPVTSMPLKKEIVPTTSRSSNMEVAEEDIRLPYFSPPPTPAVDRLVHLSPLPKSGCDETRAASGKVHKKVIRDDTKLKIEEQSRDFIGKPEAIEPKLEKTEVVHAAKKDEQEIEETPFKTSFEIGKPFQKNPEKKEEVVAETTSPTDVEQNFVKQILDYINTDSFNPLLFQTKVEVDDESKHSANDGLVQMKLDEAEDNVKNSPETFKLPSFECIDQEKQEDVPMKIDTAIDDGSDCDSKADKEVASVQLSEYMYESKTLNISFDAKKGLHVTTLPGVKKTDVGLNTYLLMLVPIEQNKFDFTNFMVTHESVNRLSPDLQLVSFDIMRLLLIKNAEMKLAKSCF